METIAWVVETSVWVVETSVKDVEVSAWVVDTAFVVEGWIDVVGETGSVEVDTVPAIVELT